MVSIHGYLMRGFWLQKSPLERLVSKGAGFLAGQFELGLSSLRTPGHVLWLVTCFIFIFLNNLLGLLPYVFTASRHLAFSFTFSLVRWLTYYLLFLVKGAGHFLAHLVPIGTPYVLIPLIVLIELIRGLIRPLTLGVRLVANMVAGHLLLVLVRGSLRQSRWAILRVRIIGLLSLMLLERGVSLIQGYVFSLLSSLYLAERNWRGLHYLNNKPVSYI